MSSDEGQSEKASLKAMFPAHLKPQAQEGTVDAAHKAFYQAIKTQGRTYAPIPQWAQVENAYKNQFGRILDDAAGKSGGVSEADLQKQLGKAAQEADGLLAQSAG